MQVSKDSIDLGIVVTDEKAALGFYRDQLGLEWEGELPPELNYVYAKWLFRRELAPFPLLFPAVTQADDESRHQTA